MVYRQGLLSPGPGCGCLSLPAGPGFLHPHILVHVRIHGRTDQNRTGHGQHGGGQGIVCNTVGQFADAIGCGRAMTARSDLDATSICETPEPGPSHKSSSTGFSESTSKVVGPTNRAAARVMDTTTSAPAFLKSRSNSTHLYAAIPPVTPKKYAYHLIPSIDSIVYGSFRNAVTGCTAQRRATPIST